MWMPSAFADVLTKLAKDSIKKNSGKKSVTFQAYTRIVSWCFLRFQREWYLHRAPFLPETKAAGRIRCETRLQDFSLGAFPPRKISWFSHSSKWSAEWTMKAQTSSRRFWWCSFNGKAIGKRRHGGLSVTCLRNAGSATTTMTMTTIAKRERHRRRWERRDSSFLPGFAYHFTYLSFLSKFSDDVCCVSIMLARNIEQGGRGNSEIKYRDWGFGSRYKTRIDSRTRFYTWNCNKVILRTSKCFYMDVVIELLYFDKK